MLLENVELNSSDGKLVSYSSFNCAVTGNGKKVGLTLLPNHPAGTITNESDAKGQIQSKRLSDIVRDKAGPICVKMDCEGAEVGIFRDDPSWMDHVDIVMMEWHDHDGHLFQNELTKRGFKVELERCGPRPQDPVDLSVTRGLLLAKR